MLQNGDSKLRLAGLAGFFVVITGMLIDVGSVFVSGIIVVIVFGVSFLIIMDDLVMALVFIVGVRCVSIICINVVSTIGVLYVVIVVGFVSTCGDLLVVIIVSVGFVSIIGSFGIVCIVVSLVFREVVFGISFIIAGDGVEVDCVMFVSSSVITFVSSDRLKNLEGVELSILFMCIYLPILQATVLQLTDLFMLL